MTDAQPAVVSLRKINLYGCGAPPAPIGPFAIPE
jgi:hypothetical protein